MNWIDDLFSPERRSCEELYRNRWQYDKVVRSSHGVNCTGSCPWNVFVKDGLVTWELQSADFPTINPEIPDFNPRGCTRGISFSWYLYSPLRIKYPYIRGVLADLWKKAKSIHKDPVLAWQSIMEDPIQRKQIQKARGKGGMRRASWDDLLELIAASAIYTIKKYGPDRIAGFSPIPAMSMVSYAAGSRFIQLLGGALLSFYDWYSDLPPASPEVFGEQTDVAESADWFNSKFIAAVGSNINITRTPDAHYLSEAKYNGAKVVIFSPEFNSTAKHGDWWISIKTGQDGAFWMAVNHVILTEFYIQQRIPYFTDYIKKYSDAPFLVTLQETELGYIAGKYLHAVDFQQWATVEHGAWKLLVWDEDTNQLKMPKGTLGFRWQKEKGNWNLDLTDTQDGSRINPCLSFHNSSDERVMLTIKDFSQEKLLQREIPVKKISTIQGIRYVATVFDLMLAEFGVCQEYAGDYPQSYQDPSMYSPAWQEPITGIHRDTVIEFARQWANTAIKTEGKCMIIIGSGVNHWYHNDLIYRSAITALTLCGCIGKNGGGWNHYVGQEKVIPAASWANLAMAFDWQAPPRLQNTPAYHYIHSDQWRYDYDYKRFCPSLLDTDLTRMHPADLEVKAVRSGWFPFFPQFNKSSLQLVEEAKKEGKTSQADVVSWLVSQLKERKVEFAVQNPDAESNFPRLWFIWRANALSSSAKGHEYFLKHYLGTDHSALAEETTGDMFTEILKNDKGPEGKFDLIVDLNFRMDTSAMYSDIVLPTATWYEKNDLTSTDLHSFIHTLSEAVPPCWESRTDFDIFKSLARVFSNLSQTHFPNPIQDIVAVPLLHDTPGEVAQEKVQDWYHGECEPIPGKTMPNFSLVERDYPNLYQRFISAGPNLPMNGVGFHGISWQVKDVYEQLKIELGSVEWNQQSYPSLETDVNFCNAILALAPETNGELAYRAFLAEEEKVGLPLADLALHNRGIRYRFEDLQKQPRRALTSPVWTGILNQGRTYAGFTSNVEKLIPWRTLSGRQHFYIDHEGFIAYGEQLPTFKPRPGDQATTDFDSMGKEEKGLILNYLTPHGKWQIHSTYFDNLRMLTLSRGIGSLWLNDQDALQIGILDNDWVEASNDHGTVVTRAIVTSRLPRGICMIYHAPERTISVPKSPRRNRARGGVHNSLVRTRLKPVLMMGGYAHLTYFFNYWGPTGVNRDTYVLVRPLGEKPEF